jgi:tetratricopeptide (TPR) repeat protein
MAPPQPRLAVARLDACAALKSRFPWIYLLRGLAHAGLAEFDDAANDYRKALELGPDLAARYAIYVHRGLLRVLDARQIEAAQTVMQGVAALPGLDWVLVYAGAARLQKERKLAEAADSLREAVKLKPEQFQAYATLAQVYQQQGHRALSLGQLDEAIRRAPELSRLYYERALAHEQGHDSDAALHDFGRAIVVEQRAGNRPEDLTGYYLACGRILLRRKQYHETIEVCRAALSASPDSAEAHLLSAEANLQLGRYREVLVALNGYTNKGVLSARVYGMRGQACVHLRHHTEAVAAFTQALNLAADPRILAARGWEYLIVFESPQLALADFREAIRLDSTSGDAYSGRGFALVQLGLYREAVADAVSALRLTAPSAPAHYKAARIYAQAAGAVAASTREGALRILLQTEYAERALSLLQSSLSLLPAGSQRTRFWQEEVRVDPALNPIRETPGFARLAQEFSGPGR